MTDRLPNAVARRLFLHLHELGATPASLRRDLPDFVRRLGFVQIDSIRTFERAHHHILASRLPRYRPSWTDHHVERERSLFENWTHDASLIPVEYFGWWKPRFRRTGPALMRTGWWRQRVGENPERTCAMVLEHVAANGPVMTRDLKAANPDPPEGMAATAWWGWHPARAALVFLWRTGRVAVTARNGFQKVYDLTERVIPQPYRDQDPTEDRFIDWHCRGAFERLGFADEVEIVRFWEAIGREEVAGWCAGAGRDATRPIEIENHDGTVQQCLARADLTDLLATLPDPSPRVRFLSPFDPLVRDRRRAFRLFGFDFRIEIYVPRAQRRFGYYVYPMLERDRLIGRIEMRRNRDTDTLEVLGLWPEPGVRLSRQRQARIERELDRWRRYAGLGRADRLPAS